MSGSGLFAAPSASAGSPLKAQRAGQATAGMHSWRVSRTQSRGRHLPHDSCRLKDRRSPHFV